MFEDEGRRIARVTILVVVGLSLFSGISVLGITIYQNQAGGFDKDVAGAAVLGPQQFKGPMLEQEEGEVLAKVRAAEEKLLGEYVWLDRNQGLARVPIEVAMEAVAAGAPTSTTIKGGSP